MLSQNVGELRHEIAVLRGEIAEMRIMVDGIRLWALSMQRKRPKSLTEKDESQLDMLRLAIAISPPARGAVGG